jgi:hypothetical protein
MRTEEIPTPASQENEPRRRIEGKRLYTLDDVERVRKILLQKVGNSKHVPEHAHEGDWDEQFPSTDDIETPEGFWRSVGMSLTWNHGKRVDINPGDTEKNIRSFWGWFHRGEISWEDVNASELLAELLRGKEYMEQHHGSSWQDYMEHLMRERADKMREEGFPVGGTERTVQDVRVDAFMARGARCRAILDLLDKQES